MTDGLFVVSVEGKRRRQTQVASLFSTRLRERTKFGAGGSPATLGAVLSGPLGDAVGWRRRIGTAAFESEGGGPPWTGERGSIYRQSPWTDGCARAQAHSFVSGIESLDPESRGATKRRNTALLSMYASSQLGRGGVNTKQQLSRLQEQQPAAIMLGTAAWRLSHSAVERPPIGRPCESSGDERHQPPRGLRVTKDAVQTDLAGRTSYVRRDAAWWVGGRVLDETNEIGTGLTLGERLVCGGGGEGVSATSQGVQKPFPSRRNGMQFAPGGDAFWEQSMCSFSPGGGSGWVCLGWLLAVGAMHARGRTRAGGWVGSMEPPVVAVGGFGPPTGGAGERAGGWTALRCLPTHTALRIERRGWVVGDDDYDDAAAEHLHAFEKKHMGELRLRHPFPFSPVTATSLPYRAKKMRWMGRGSGTQPHRKVVSDDDEPRQPLRPRPHSASRLSLVATSGRETRDNAARTAAQSRKDTPERRSRGVAFARAKRERPFELVSGLGKLTAAACRTVNVAWGVPEALDRQRPGVGHSMNERVRMNDDAMDGPDSGLFDEMACWRRSLPGQHARLAATAKPAGSSGNNKGQAVQVSCRCPLLPCRLFLGPMGLPMARSRPAPACLRPQCLPGAARLHGVGQEQRR
ncbi:hypothetical protein Purlil1_8830 [Purpureocillium lilacinum]|uniref:Uncharacterized protein n=1 Tax=Purpureocillium lilacinum TaxID=33203 RepID=A0ABR0BSC4_PURLI|nr:hypothetical protein Purlil1_8830 [Purpureocillium lilacinum]